MSDELPNESIASFDVIYWKGLQLRVDKNLSLEAHVAFESSKPITLLKEILGDEQFTAVALLKPSVSELVELLTYIGHAIRGLNEQ